MNPSKPSLETALQAVPAPVSLKAGGIQWVIRSGALRDALGDLLAQPDRFAADEHTRVHQSWLVTIARVPSGDSRTPWLLRRSNYAKSSARQRDFFRVAAPIRAFRNALALEQAGISTPRAIAAGVRRVMRVPRAGYLLTGEVREPVALARLTQQSKPIPPGLVKVVTAAIVQLHERGFIHGDLTINNVLLDAAQQPWFIDLERTRKVRGAVGWRHVVEDFHRLARHYRTFSAAGRRGALRLMVSYCRKRGWQGRGREFIRALERRLRRKLGD